MAVDVSKQLERAKKFLEKNRVEDAIEAYLAVLDGSPQHLVAHEAGGGRCDGRVFFVLWSVVF